MVARPSPDPRLFAALGDATRLSLIDRLAGAPFLTTTALVDGTGMTRQAVRKHLGVLQEAGLVRDRRVGRERRWSLQPAPLADVSAWASTIRRHWEERLDRLDAFLAETAEDDDADQAH